MFGVTGDCARITTHIKFLVARQTAPNYGGIPGHEETSLLSKTESHSLHPHSIWTDSGEWISHSCSKTSSIPSAVKLQLGLGLKTSGWDRGERLCRPLYPFPPCTHPQLLISGPPAEPAPRQSSHPLPHPNPNFVIIHGSPYKFETQTWPSGQKVPTPC